MELIGLDHFAVNVRDVAASAQWYADRLGFRTLHAWSNATMVGRGNIKVGLFSKPAAQPIANTDDLITIAHIAFLVDGDKFKDAFTEIQANGVPIEGPEDTGIAYSFFIRDLDGHKLEFTTYYGAPPPIP